MLSAAGAKGTRPGDCYFAVLWAFVRFVAVRVSAARFSQPCDSREPHRADAPHPLALCAGRRRACALHHFLQVLQSADGNFVVSRLCGTVLQLARKWILDALLGRSGSDLSLGDFDEPRNGEYAWALAAHRLFDFFSQGVEHGLHLFFG